MSCIVKACPHKRKKKLHWKSSKTECLVYTSNKLTSETQLKAKYLVSVAFKTKSLDIHSFIWVLHQKQYEQSGKECMTSIKSS